MSQNSNIASVWNTGLLEYNLQASNGSELLGQQSKHPQLRGFPLLASVEEA